MDASDLEKLKGILKTLSAQEYTLKLGGVFDLTKSYEFFHKMVDKLESGDWKLDKKDKKEEIKPLEPLPPIPQAEPTKKKAGRPKGSKNKPKWDLRNGD